MSVQSVAGKFMELCKQGKHFEVMRTMYAPEMVSVEGDGKEVPYEMDCFPAGRSDSGGLRRRRHAPQTDGAALQSCFDCHQAFKDKDRDFVFTHYAP